MLASLYSEEVSIFEKYEILSYVMCENGYKPWQFAVVSSTGLYYMAFTGMETLTRKTNWAVVEQHGLVHQWRSSSGPKKERFGVFDQNSRFQKRVLRTNEREQENGS